MNIILVNEATYIYIFNCCNIDDITYSFYGFLVVGLNKVAKKLDIDCVPAMVGWDSHCGFSHPV